MRHNGSEEGHLPQCSAHSQDRDLRPYTSSSMCSHRERVSLDRVMSMTDPDNLWHRELFGDKMETFGRTQISLPRLSVSPRCCR